MLSFYFKKLTGILKGEIMSGGLEISDSTLRFAYFDGRVWQMVSMRMEVGTIKENQILDRAKFVASLVAFKKEILKRDRPNKKISVVLTLSSVSVYTQIFSLPLLSGTALEEAIELNLKMTTPSGSDQTYSGYQVVGRDEAVSRVDVLAAFISKSFVDQVTEALFEAGFIAVAIEPRAISLSRLVREESVGLDSYRSFIVMSVDNEAIEILILRGQQVYFEYFNSWRQLQGDLKQISLADFKNTITRNLRQVITYYGQHWSDPVSDIVLISPGLNEEIKKIITEGFQLKIIDLSLRLDKPIAAEWFVVLGAAVRARGSLKADDLLTLAGEGAQATYRESQIISFINFWSFAVAAIFILLLSAYVATYFYLGDLEDKFGGKNVVVDAEKNKELSELRAEAANFNASVLNIAGTKRLGEERSSVLELISKITAESQVTITRFSFSSFGTALTLSALAPSTDNIFALEKVLRSDSRFGSVDFDPTKISKESPYVFSINFSIASPKTP